jgi:hypothetical protein
MIWHSSRDYFIPKDSGLGQIRDFLTRLNCYNKFVPVI